MTGDPALLLLTSDSTRPKGVGHSHREAFHAIDISGQLLELNDADTVLVGKPISHAGGLQTQLMPALQAGTRVILRMKPPPQEACRLIDRFQVTQYAMLASDLLDFVECAEQHPIRLPSLRNCLGSGDAVPHELHHRFLDLFGWPGDGRVRHDRLAAASERVGMRRQSISAQLPRLIDDTRADVR